MRNPSENRATMEAYTIISIQSRLLGMAMLKWMMAATGAIARDDWDASERMTKVFEQYALKVLPELIQAKKFMDVDYEKDQTMLDLIMKHSGDKTGVYSLDELLKDIKIQEDK